MKDIDQLLREGRLDDLIGRAESATLEAKSQPLGHLDSDPAERYELAKDVSALANGEGGHLVVGVQTERQDDRALDVLAHLALMPAEDFPRVRYEGVIKEHVYPRIQGLRVSFVVKAGESAGIGLVTVPKQHDDRKPFLIARVVDGDDVIKQIVFGLAQRVEDAAEPMTLAELHAAVRKGRDSIAVRLTGIEDKLDQVLDRVELPSRPAAEENSLLDERLHALLENDNG